MRAVTVSISPRSLARTIALLTVGLIAANCSSDATRLNENPFASKSAAPESTGSVPHGQGASYGQVESRPLAAPPMAGQPLPPPTSRRPGTYGGTSGGGQGMGSFQPSADYGRPQLGAPEVTGAVPRLQSEPRSSWNWEGGTPITVAPGDTLASLSQRYGVPAPAIAEANGLTGPAALRPGQRLVIPRYNGPAAAAPAAPRPVATNALSGALRAPMSSVHVVAPGETMVGIARRYQVPIAQLAAANNMAPHTMLKMGDRLVIPGKSGLGGRTAAATPQPQAAPTPVATAQTRPVATAPVADKPTQGQQQIAQLDQKETIRAIKPASEALADDERPANGSAPAFRWPVKGRVIANFGSKSNGQQNDGINLAVPEGTAVRAAEDGVVAYAGSELKGYGNLILVRHSNGYVTAYAHASEIMVKRNDQVRRGQVIAKSGQTGSVSAPQLHFEIRKGSSPVDPIQHLPSGV